MRLVKSPLALALLTIPIILGSLFVGSAWQGGYFTSDEVLQNAAHRFAKKCQIRNYTVDTVDEEMSGAPNYVFIHDPVNSKQKRTCLYESLNGHFHRVKEKFEISLKVQSQ